nr:uncharacterized protein LOC129434311 [Misgurnus anguillicaudatus]
MMDLQTNNIVDIQLVQSNEVGGSYHMEKEGLRRSLNRLSESGVTLDCIVTDRHPQIQKFLKDRKIKHYYDVWHMAKGLSKKVEKISREKDCSLVKKWHKSIINHLYWSATSSASGPEKLAKWTSIINHIQDIHTHSDPAFPRCKHAQRLSKDRRKWFQPGSRALNRLQNVLIKKSPFRCGKAEPTLPDINCRVISQSHLTLCTQKCCVPLHRNAMQVISCSNAL